MIPILEEQSAGSRHPFFEVYAAWGGDLALSSGLVGCTATASSAAAGYPASNANDGDKTVLNASWWESTNVGGEAFLKVTDGYVFHDEFEDFSNWSAELTAGSPVSNVSTADSPWARFAVASSAAPAAGYVFRRSSSTYSFSSERIYQFALDVPSCRSYSDTQYNNISFILCPTSVATAPFAEANWLTITMESRNEGLYIIVGKSIASVYTEIYTSGELTTTKKQSNFRVIVDATILSVWHEDLGYIVDSIAHGLSFTTSYIYLQLGNKSGDVREGSVGYLSIFKGQTQVVQNLNDATMVSLKATDLLNTDFSRSGVYATQDYVEDFQKYTLGTEPWEYIVGDNGGNGEFIVNNYSGLCARLYNDEDYWTWCRYTQRKFYDFEMTSEIYFPNFGNYEYLDEDFESYYELLQNNCYVFDGTNDYVSMGDVLNLEGGDFTIATWLYAGTLVGNQVFVGKGQWTVNGWYAQKNGNILQIVSTPGTTLTTCSQTISASTWYHVVITRSGGTFRVFIDGVEPGYTASGVHTVLASTADFTYGAYPVGKTSKWNGKLSMFQVWDRRLTEAEIELLYHWSNISTDRQAFYKCAEGTGTTSTDEEGNYNGTITTDDTTTFHAADANLLASGLSESATKDWLVDNFIDTPTIDLIAHVGNQLELNNTGNVWVDTNNCFEIATSGLVTRKAGKGSTYTNYIDCGRQVKIIRWSQYVNNSSAYNAGVCLRSVGTSGLVVKLHSDSSGSVYLQTIAGVTLVQDTSWTISVGWFDVEIVDTETNVKVYVDGTLYVDYDTSTYVTQYGVGFFSWTGCSPQFKRLRIKTNSSVWDYYSRPGFGSSPPIDDQAVITSDRYLLPQVAADWSWWKYNEWQYRKCYNLTNYRLEFDRKDSNRMIAMLRVSDLEPSTGYYVSYTNGSELAIRKFSSSPITATNLHLESGADVPVPDTEAVKIEITGTDKVTIKLWMGTNIYREVVDDVATVYTEGTFGFLTNGTHCQVDNLVVTVLTESVQEFNHLIRVDSAFNNGYVLRHDLINDRFQLCKGMAAGVGQSSVLSTTAYDYGPPGQWYKVRCLVLDNRIQVWINGTSVMDYTDNSSPVLSGYFGFQLKPGAMYQPVGDYVGYGYIRNIIIHSACFPSYWEPYNVNCGFVIQQTPDYIWYPELMLTKTSADSTDFSWVEISDATSSIDGEFYDENHRGGYLSSDCSSVGTPAGSSSTAIQTATYVYRSVNNTTCYIGVHHIADSDGGKYEIWANTTLVGTIDTYNAAKTYEWVNVGSHQFSGGGTHTITLKKIGEKNAASSDYWVRVLEIGLFFTEDAIPTTSVTRAFSEGASKTDVNDPQYSLMMIADQTVIFGQECGVKQSITFPKGQPAYITAVVSTDTANTQVTLIESLTGTSMVATLAVAHQDYTLSLPRTNIEGGRGEIGLYISSVPLYISKVYVKSLTVLGGELGEYDLTHLLAPYTASAVTLTGTVPEFSYSNLLLSSESLNSTEWYKYGTLTFDTVEYSSPYDDGELNAEKIQFSDNSYFYQTVEYDYKEKTLTFSVWLKSDGSSSEIYLGLIEDWENPKGEELIKVTLTDTWQRFTVTNDILDSTITTDNKLYVYIGTDGLGVLDDITSTPEIYVWGSQLAESSNLCRYYPRGNTDLLGSTDLNQFPWTERYSQPSTLDLTIGFATSRLSGCIAPYIFSVYRAIAGDYVNIYDIRQGTFYYKLSETGDWIDGSTEIFSVVMWYNQFKSTYHAYQPVAANRPTLELNQNNGLPHIVFSDSHYLRVDYDLSPATNPNLGVAVLFESDDIANMGKVYGHDNGGFDRCVGFDTRVVDYAYFDGTTAMLYDNLALNTLYTDVHNWTVSTFDGWINGVSRVVAGACTNGAGNTYFYIGAEGSTLSEMFEGKMSAFFLRDSVFTTTERQSIERFFDALYKGNVQIKEVTSLSSFTFDSLVWSEDFSSYSVGTDLTGEGWTEHNYDATTRSFTAENGAVAVGAVDPNTSYCSYRWDNAAAQEWGNYEFRFTLTKDLIDSEVLGINFRYTTSGGYSIIYDPASSELRLYRCSDPDMITGRTLVANWDASIPSSMSEVRVAVKDSTVDFIVDDVLIGTYTGLVYTKGSVGYTFGKTDVTYTESISLTDIEVRVYTLANKIDLTSAGVDTNSAYYDSGAALTGRTFEASIWLRAFTGEGDVYIVIEDSSATNYAIRKVTLTKDWQKVTLPMTFPYTVDTDLYVKILTAAYDTYGALSDISIEAWGASLYEETHDSDHSHIWEGTVNLILRSEEFDHASWSKHGTTTVTADQWVNPLFNMESADKIVNVTAGHGVYQSQVVVAPASNTFTFSIWVRADGDTDFYLEINDDPGGQTFQEEFTAKPYWQRFEFTATFVASVQAGTICELRAKDASSTIYAWGAQFEQKSNYATKYEQTIAATTTRNDTRLRYTTPTAVTTYDQDWSVLMRVSLLADAYDSTEKHTLLTLGAYSSTTNNTARLYLENGYLKLDIQDDNSETYSQTVVLPVEDMDLYGEYVFGIIREDEQWSFFLRTQNNEYSGTITDTGFILPQYYYVGVLDDNSDHGNAKVSDVTMYDRSLTSSEVLAFVTSSYNTQYDLTNIIQAIIPYRGSTSSYISGGSVEFTLGIDTEYPLDVEWGLWEGTDQLLMQSEYTIYGGTVWEYDPDWLLLTFDSEITFNRVNLYAYPNKTSSLQTPYDAGKGGLKAWLLDYWDSADSVYKPFYRKLGSTTDLDIIDLTQLCTNGIFEEDLSDWVTTTDYVTLSQDQTEFLTGLHSMKVEIYSAPSLGQGPRYVVTFLPGNTYVATGWAKGIGSLHVEAYDGDSWHYGDSVVLSSSEWQKLTVTFTVSSSTTLGASFIQFVTDTTTTATFNLDEVTIIPTVTRSITTSKIRLLIQNLQNDGDVARVTELQVFNFIDESSKVKDNNITLTYRKTSETNFISPGQFQVVLSNLDGRYSPKNSVSPIYGVTQLDGRGWVRAGTPIEIWGGYETVNGDYFKSPLMKGTIGSEQDPAANTGVELDTSEETVTLIGGDYLTQLERTIINDYNILDSESYESLLTYLCQIAGFAVQDMQFDESGVNIGYSWFGDGATVLDIINKIVEASDGAFFAHPSQLKRALFYYDGIKFKSWLQTTKDDFDAGSGTNITTSVSPGNVLLIQGAQTQNMFSWLSVSDVYYGYYWGRLSLYDQTTYSYTTLNVKDYHMESPISENWDYALATASSIFRYTNGGVGIDTYNRCKAQSYDGASTSIIGFNNLNLGTEPVMIVELVDEAGEVLVSTEYRLYNSGEGYEVVTDLENGVIPDPSTAGATASYTIRFTTTTTVNLGEYLYVYFPAQTGVANGSWGNEHAGIGLAIAGVTLDGKTIFRWFATEAAYKKISMRTAIPGSGLTIYPGNHELIIDSAVVNTITNPASNGTSYKLYVATSHENYLWSENYRIGYDNGVGPGTYYFSRHRAYNTGSYLGRGALTGRSDAFVVPVGKRRIPKVYHWGGGSSDKDWNQDTLYWQVNPADPDDVIYYSYAPASPNWTFVVHGSPVSAWDNKYFAAGRYIGSADLLAGWNVIELYDWATASALNLTGGRIKLRMKFKGQDSQYSFLQTKEYFDFNRYVARFTFRVMQFENTILIDSVKYGAARNPLTGYAISNSFDTSDTAPNWGDLTISVLRALLPSKNERVKVYSQTSDDAITWYGLGGSGQWDIIIDHYTTLLTRSARIVSPSKRYIRFKVKLTSTDTYYTPIVSNMSFKYTNNGDLISQYVDATTTINKWGIFQSNYTLGDYGTITFETLSADDASFTLPDPAGWQTATPGALITSAVKRYLKWRAYLETSYGEYTPSLHDVTINWEKGLTVPSEVRSYSYDNRLKTFVPKSGNPSCNKATGLSNFYLVDPSIVTNDITAYWNGGGSSLKTCGAEVASYPTLPLSVDAATRTIIFECSDPTMTPNSATYNTYPRAFVVTVGGVNYGIYGYIAGSQEGTQFSFLAGALKLTFSGTAKRITVIIETTGATSLSDIKLYGYSIKKAGDLTPPLLLATTNEDTDSQALYNHVFLKEINNEYITSENAADTLTSLLINEGKFVKDYGQITIPIAFSLNLQTKFVITQPNAGWDNQVAEAYEIQHRGSDWTTSITLKEK